MLAYAIWPSPDDFATPEIAMLRTFQTDWWSFAGVHA
jgi:hypothetical protein